MGAILSYSIAVSLIVILLFPVLHQIVSRSTLFRFNRFIVLCGMVLSLLLPCLIPLVNVSPSISVGAPLPIKWNGGMEDNIMPETVASEEATEGISWIAVAVCSYLTGIFVLVSRETIAFVRLFHMIDKCEKTKCEGHIVCRLTDSDIAPFSWGKYIFLHNNEAGTHNSCVYLHEKAHTEKKHWIDILFADLFCILLWYNPFAWMTRQLMKLNHEFEADSTVIASGIDTYDYQRLLVIKTMGVRAIPVANSFAASKRSFRKRVLIMNKKRSSKKNMLIAFCAIPAVALGAIVIASPVSAGLLDFISDFRLNKEETSNVSVVAPESVDSHDSDQTEISSVNQVELSRLISLAVQQNIDKISGRSLKIDATIEIDNDGYIKGVTVNEPDGQIVRTIIDEALRGVRFNVKDHDEKSIVIHYRVPSVIKQKAEHSNSTGNTTGSVVMPEFSGGPNAFNSFVIENIRYPGNMNNADRKGKRTVSVQFAVDTNGKVRDTKIVRSQGEAFDNEALRVIKLTDGKWTPATENGKKQKCTMVIPITFTQA